MGRELPRCCLLYTSPALIGFVLNEYCKGPVVDGMQTYDYTLPMWIFAGFGAVSYTHLDVYKRQERQHHIESKNEEKK